MRVLHVMNGPMWGGSYQMASLLCAEQRKLGVYAQLCYLEGGDSKARAMQLGAPVIGYDPDTVHTSKLARWRDLEQGYSNIVRSFSPDLVVTHNSLSHLLTSRIRSDASGFRWIPHMHQPWRAFAHGPDGLRRPWLKHYLNYRHGLGDAWATRKADYITTVSEYVRREYSSAGISLARLGVVYNGIVLSAEQSQPNLRSEWGIPATARIIGSLGYFAPAKGFQFLLLAFDHIAQLHDDAHLVIAGGDISGDTRFRHMLLTLKSVAQYGDRIHILGAQASGAAFMRNIDICAVPSITEGFSLVLVEAMQFGKPGVVTSAGGCREVCRHEQEGLVFESRNIQDLASKLNRLLSYSDLASRLGKAGYTRAHTEFTIERSAQNHLRVYEEILSKTRKG